MNLNLGLDFQPNFPARDVTDRTAATLEELFQEPDLLTTCHTQAETLNLLYRMGHRTFYEHAGANLNSDQLAALSTGMRLYEATSTIVRPTIHSIDESTVVRHVSHMGSELSSDRGIMTIIDARDSLITELPRAAQMLARSATHFAARYSDYLVGGAGVARQVELRAMNDLSSFEDQFDF